MDAVTSMKITGLTFTDFRNHTKAEHYDFDDLSYITGHNGTGKTTMAHGIAYALYGVSYYGEQKIERLMNENAGGTEVQLDFTDQTGSTHTLIRRRQNDKTSLFLNSYPIRQADIDCMICDKDTFLSMFNPTYLTERLGEKGRELILKYLKPIPAETVISEIGAKGEYLRMLDLTRQSPENLMKGFRETIRETERQINILEGQIQSMQDMTENSEQKLTELYKQKQQTEERIHLLTEKQYAGIDLDDLAIQRDVLYGKLNGKTEIESAEAVELRAKLEQVKQEVRISQYAPMLTETQAEIKLLSNRYRALKKNCQELQPGSQCPTCLTRVTEENLPDMKNVIQNRLKEMSEKGNTLVGQEKEIELADKRSQEAFDKQQAEKIEKLTAQLRQLEQQESAEQGKAEIQQQIDRLDELQRFGNLNEQERLDIVTLHTELTGINAQIKVIEDRSDKQRLQSAQTQKEAFTEQQSKNRNLLSALSDYICKRTELATRELQMPNVSIRLYDVVRTTGEVVSAFRFTYKGRDYTTLSLSEKTLAGVEIAAMVRRITGIDCPICIDNTESIAAFNAVDMPSQTLLLRFVKGQPLSVQSKHFARMQPTEQLAKAS